MDELIHPHIYSKQPHASVEASLNTLIYKMEKEKKENIFVLL